MECLHRLNTVELKDQSARHREIVTLLVKVIQNLVDKPEDLTVRYLNKSGKAVNEKIMPYMSVCQFMTIMGFDFEKSPTHITLPNYITELLQTGIKALEAHIISLGGQVEKQGFNPYA